MEGVLEDSISEPYYLQFRTAVTKATGWSRDPFRIRSRAKLSLSLSHSNLPVGCFSVPELNNHLCNDTLAHTHTVILQTEGEQ